MPARVQPLYGAGRKESPGTGLDSSSNVKKNVKCLFIVVMHLATQASSQLPLQVHSAVQGKLALVHLQSPRHALLQPHLISSLQAFEASGRVD